MYIVAGGLTPKPAAQGERYRHGLQDESRALGLADRVCLDDSDRDW